MALKGSFGFRTQGQDMLMGKKQRRKTATRERLLDAAEMLFAHKGYNGITVREITRKAQCNQAAVNYHFRSKKNLYLEVFKSRWIPRSKRIQSSFWNSLEMDPHPSPDLVIRHVVKAFLYAPVLNLMKRLFGTINLLQGNWHNPVKHLTS